MGQISSAALAKGGKSAGVDFSIKLESCSTATLKTVKAKFSGRKDADINENAILLIGTAKNAGLVMYTDANKPVVLGTETAPQNLQDGNNTLSYKAYLLGAADEANAPIPGAFTATTTFELTYQ